MSFYPAKGGGRKKISGILGTRSIASNVAYYGTLRIDIKKGETITISELKSTGSTKSLCVTTKLGEQTVMTGEGKYVATEDGELLIDLSQIINMGGEGTAQCTYEIG